MTARDWGMESDSEGLGKWRVTARDGGSGE